MNIIYIAGPMTGIPDLNFHAFEAAEKKLKELGHIVRSPHRIKQCCTYEEYLRVDLKLLLTCDTIAMLPGWNKSNGAKKERIVSDAIGNTTFLLDKNYSIKKIILPKKYVP